MSTEMTRKVGAAILLAELEWTPKSTLSKEESLARAALEAMREPTPGMAEAGSEYLGKYLDVTGTYTAMVDAALT